MKNWNRGLGLAAVLAGGAVAAHGQTWQFGKINPKSTYLRDSQAAADPLTIRLGPWDTEGRWLELRTVGWFNRAIDNPASHNISNQAVAVFSVNGIVDTNFANQFRVGSAVKGGLDFYTLPTWVGNLPTDISQDFGVGPNVLRVEIPNGANYLHFTPYDNGFWNNGDDFSMPNADPRGFGVEWRTLSAVPEPGTIGIVAVGVGALLRRHGRRRTVSNGRTRD